MTRTPGPGSGTRALALIIVLLLVGAGALAANALVRGPAGTAATPVTPASQPSVQSSERPEPVVYTNPDGPSASQFPPDHNPVVLPARKLPGIAGVWIDANGLDIHVAVTTDVEGAIRALGPHLPRGVTLYVHLAEYSHAFLDRVFHAIFDERTELMGLGIVVSSGGVDEIGNRVTIRLSPFLPETVSFMRDRYPGPIDYEDGGPETLHPFTPPELGAIRLTAIRDGDDTGLLTCGRRPFAESALTSAGGAESGVGAEYDALRESVRIYSGLLDDLASLTWIEAEADEYGATFLARRGDEWLEAPVLAGADGWVPGTLDACAPREVSGGDAVPAAWALDPEHPAPTRTTTELHLLIVEQECAYGRSPAGRIARPAVTYYEGRVNLDIAVRPVFGGCPANPLQPVTVTLPEALGDRRLDGGVPAENLRR
ncbi:hypothetical protein BH24CHL5_BH24CHL5_05760 [soil metagenome]